MLDWLKSFLDAYERNAQLKPALLASLPLVASTVLVIPEFGVVWGSIGGLVLYSGGAIVLIQVSRDAGRALEARLHESWGGKPSVAMLRHSDGRLNRLTKERYRRFLDAVVPGPTLSSVGEEQEAPEQADERFESANSWLLERTRDRDRFGLLFRENMNYGFRRNLLGLKPVALGMAVIALVFVIGNAVASWKGHLMGTVQALSPEWWVSLAVTTGHIGFFVLWIKGEWVRLAAERYAKQLLAACDVLDGGTGA